MNCLEWAINYLHVLRVSSMARFHVTSVLSVSEFTTVGVCAFGSVRLVDVATSIDSMPSVSTVVANEATSLRAINVVLVLVLTLRRVVFEFAVGLFVLLPALLVVVSVVQEEAAIFLEQRLGDGRVIMAKLPVLNKAVVLARKGSIHLCN
jgi:hypothetical protein